MSDGWTTLGELPDGTLVEMGTGECGVIHFKQRGGAGHVAVVYLRNDPLAKQSFVPPIAEARPIDLAFLLTVANDCLGEHEGYQRGLRDGAAAMRERAAKVAESIDWPDHVTQIATVCAMTADAIRALPTTEES